MRTETIRKTIRIVIAVVIIVLIALSVLGYVYNWGWVGVTDYAYIFNGDLEVFQRSKTLWDWLDLLIIPAIIGLGLYELNQSARESERKIALDNQRQATLEAYIDRISELMLDKREIKGWQDVARVRTLITLGNLDKVRKGQVVHFLHEAYLIRYHSAYADRKRVDLRRADLRGANLSGADLSYSNLSEANLSEAKLSGANLSGTHLSKADLRGASLVETNLVHAYLIEADLRGAYLKDVDLSNADLIRACLSEAKLSGANLSEAKLGDADLSYSDLRGANLSEAKLFGANLIETDLRRATNFPISTLAEADKLKIKYNDKTRWPEGFNT